ncbi:vesicle-associated membrane protein 3-like [Convolutriloba macropyga]|uniref:vesicle-associated membrane protein 3-like n=1 Tax=Convolutriloba macropyga TaxID=536237 RepID=UPI003F51C178
MADADLREKIQQLEDDELRDELMQMHEDMMNAQNERENADRTNTKQSESNKSPETFTDSKSSNLSNMSASYNNQQQQTRLQSTQAQVDEVVEIMSQNANKAWERGAKLDDLDNRAAALEQGSSQFATTSRKVNRKYYWKDKKMLAMLVGAVILGVGLIVLLIYLIAS